MGTEISDEQLPIDRELGAAVLSLLPDEWTGALLTVEKVPGEGDAERYHIQIAPTGKGKGSVTPDEDVELAVQKLFLLNQRFKTGLKSIAYTYRQKKDGSWGQVGEYEYDDADEEAVG
ncbi:hypothetical protein LXT21_07525 [Myxococcus sp. K38C18041901]|uniref:hypothetical protein n=1 Tax=Myxococcus guangdongensis TaxID=2906760 RepID=UPI0020A6E99B|nr:hypothetical protein [Myxococcus guangdongensis]MCP3058618.1 hypothetical protein [Myxococcus guangdongensis]